jgi:hypothetical protein
MIFPDLIYLSSPYTHAEHYMKVARFVLVSKVAAKLMGEGKYIFSPITHCHPLAELASLPENWEFWEGYDRCMIAACDKLLVLRLPGWEISKGVQAEIHIAINHGQPVEYMDYDLTPTIEQVIQMTKESMSPKMVAGAVIKEASTTYDSDGNPSSV